jgi:hypothetical protein
MAYTVGVEKPRWCASWTAMADGAWSKCPLEAAIATSCFYVLDCLHNYLDWRVLILK